MPADMPWRSMRLASRLARGRQFDLTIEGADHIPAQGPVIIAAHHHHHLFDGAALTLAVDRPVHIVAAIDWISNPRGRSLMERACGMARWPVVERLPEGSAPTRESTRTLYRSLKEVTGLLEEGRIVAIFPEGFPNIDPGFTPKSDAQPFLPFKTGYVRFAAIASHSAGPIPVVPTGFIYRKTNRWQITLRFGPPIWIGPHTNLADAARAIEQSVIALSTPAESEQPLNHA